MNERVHETREGKSVYRDEYDITDMHVEGRDFGLSNFSYLSTLLRTGARH